MKKILILLFSLFVGLFTFCNAETGSFTINCNIASSSSSVNGITFCDIFNNTFDYSKCLKLPDNLLPFIPTQDNRRSLRTAPYNGGTTHLQVPYFGNFNGIPYTGTVCGIPNGDCYLMVYLTNTQNSDICVNSGGVFEYELIDFPFGSECETCPEVDTGAILSGYIAIDDITDNYCISNGLCGEISTGMSTLYINNIWHESKPFLYVNIPEELDWDYTGNVAQMFIDIKGYNTDSDYMQSIIDINSYRPTSEDFTSIFVSGLTLIFPYLIFALFIVFMRKLIKRIFKH